MGKKEMGKERERGRWWARGGIQMGGSGEGAPLSSAAHAAGAAARGGRAGGRGGGGRGKGGGGGGGGAQAPHPLCLVGKLGLSGGSACVSCLLCRCHQERGGVRVRNK
jgi:hypothetical protein